MVMFLYYENDDNLFWNFFDGNVIVIYLYFNIFEKMINCNLRCCNEFE